ncbi:type II secretion system minor pseudopilin GspK [Massilia agilis]|uniref:Type II secretion system protein K n=1 Tax=Massilia agilis TaxID=1811226 RepID=A0ABT2DD38_9BURK|nr:type II secretion system minor pseudopilin GspK [Massilia agilis]MCS0809217.1 type II secretion system minor pseudopilin GspK [Massilia agilis]
MKMRMRARERGVAVITALLLTTLAISIVASLFWQQQVQVRSMENQRLQLQTQWIERGALDWAMLVLRQDAMDNPLYTSLDQIWATPLAETRLDQYIERERVQGENFNATLSGNVIDATSRYNLSNLAKDGQVDDTQAKVFSRLLGNLQLNPSLAIQTAKFVAAGQTPKPPDGQPAAPSTQSKTMKLVQLEDLLAIPGYTPAMIDKLRPFAIVLPSLDVTKVNVNTAPAEVLAALAPNSSVMQANALVYRRKQAPWKDVGQFQTELGTDQDLTNIASVKSDWFLVQSHIKLDRATLNAEALVSRVGNSILRSPEVKWIRQI